MSDLESTPHEPEQNISPAQELGAPTPDSGTWDSAVPIEPPAELFDSFSQPKTAPPVRIPHLGHLALLAAFLLAGFLCMTVLMLAGFFLHLGGVTTQDQIKSNVYYLLGGEAILYLVAFALSLPLFSMLWNKNFFAGVQWRGATALELGWRLPLIAVGCMGLALLDETLLPGPSKAPIEDLFRTPGAAWLMFGFGVTLAPFFEEMIFRGFLLPALATACDWLSEYVRSENKWTRPTLIAGSAVASIAIFTIYCAREFGGSPYIFIVFLILFCFIAIVLGPTYFWFNLRYQALCAGKFARPLDENGHPQWSIPAMAIASILTSLPFALVHIEQQGHSIGPFLLLITVSLILCAVRLQTRSLAASTTVHACYNFLLFAFMMVGTGGFRHFDKM
jgi:hypothetical protein